MTSPFLFQTSFDAPTRAKQATRSAAAADDMNTAKAAARAEGVEEGRRQAEDAAAARQAQALEQTLMALQDLSARLGDIRAEALGNAQRLASMLGGKLAGRLLARLPMEAVEAMLIDTLRDNLDEPRIVLRAAEPVIAALQEDIDKLGARSGFAGGIVLLADDSLHGADCRIEWADGGAEFDQAALAARIDDLMHSAAPAGH